MVDGQVNAAVEQPGFVEKAAGGCDQFDVGGSTALTNTMDGP